MKIQKATNGNVNLIDGGDEIFQTYTAGQYQLKRDADGVTIYSQMGKVHIPTDDVTHTLAGETPTEFTGDTQDLMDHLADTAFDFS